MTAAAARVAAVKRAERELLIIPLQVMAHDDDN